MFFNSTLEALSFTTRILCDPLPQTADAVYVFAMTAENQHSSIERAAELWRKGIVKKITCCDGEVHHGDSGFEFRKKLLVDLGVPKTIITPLAIPAEINVNTLTETQALVKHSKTNKWKRVIVSSTPFHQLRVFATTVSVALRKSPDLLIYNAPGTTLQWREHTRHSQGTVSGTRKELLEMEYGRLNDYCMKGDILPCENILNYLDERA